MSELRLIVLTQLLKWLFIASLFGYGNYAFWRWLEKATKNTRGVMDMLSLFAGMLLSGPILMVVAYPSILWVLALVALGAWLHRKSGGASPNFIRAYILMTISLVMSLIVGGFTFLKLFDSPFQSYFIQIAGHEVNDVQLFLGVCGLYTIFSPLAPWVWRSLRPRQGVEVPLQKEHIA